VEGGKGRRRGLRVAGRKRDGRKSWAKDAQRGLGREGERRRRRRRRRRKRRRRRRREAREREENGENEGRMKGGEAGAERSKGYLHRVVFFGAFCSNSLPNGSAG